jgi:hypothetical protein
MENLKREIKKLSLSQLYRLRNWLEDLIWELEEQEEIEPPKNLSREVVERRQVGAIVFQLEKVRCGKAACKSCPHGPYWYGYQRKEGRVTSFYVGKDLSKAKAFAG